MALLGVVAALAAAACNPSTQNASGTDTSSSTPGSTSADGSHTEQTTYQITQTISQLQLDAHSGRVTVTAGNGPISVTESFTYSDDKPVTSHAVNGDTLDLKEDGCQHERAINGRCEVGWDIQVPAGTTLTLTTRAGGIAMTGMSGQIDAKTNAGGVRARGLASKNVNAKTSAGGVDLQFTQVPDQVQATSNAGGIEIVVPAGQTYAVQADSNTGRPEVDVNQSNSSSHKIQAKTNAGSIEISNG